MKKATLYKKQKGKNVKCTACRHFCTIRDGEFGLCGIRKNEEGILYLTVYGLTSGTGIDPVEKKPLFHFMPGSQVFSVGTIGCNFACAFCQNAWMSQANKDSSVPIPPLEELPPEEIVEFCLEEDIPIIAYTYNEPAIFFEYTYDTAKLASKEGIKNIYVSNGYASKEAIDKISPYLDGINIDLKAFTENFYKDLCKARLEPVLDNIKYYYKKGIWVEITTLIIPTKNDSEKELTQIAQFIASISKSIPWHVTRFTPTYKMDKIPSTPEETIKKAYQIGKKAGLEYVYAGNIHGEDLHSSYCPKCNKVLVKRDWGYTKIQNLKNGKCSNCGKKIKGVWKQDQCIDPCENRDL